MNNRELKAAYLRDMQPFLLKAKVDNTSKMITLLGKMRKQMNGAVADSMFYYGTSYGLNYGVSLPTVREIAREQGCDHELAQYLFKQQVRELKLAAMHIADAQLITPENAQSWAEGIINSELAEEAAFALLNRCPSLTEIFPLWIVSENEFTAYAAMMAIARSEALSQNELKHIDTILAQYPASRSIGQGAVAMLAAAFMKPTLQPAVREIVESLTDTPAAQYIRDEMSWRMEF